MKRAAIVNSFLNRYRRCITVALQIGIVIGAFWGAYALRFDLHIPAPFARRFMALLPAVLVIKLVVFWRHGLFRGWWRYVSMGDILTLLRANMIASTALLVYVAMVYRFEFIPRSVLIMDAIFCFLLMGGVRFFTRALRESYFPVLHYLQPDRTHVLVVGASDAGQTIAREIRQNPRLKKQVVGFIDDNAAMLGMRFQGYPVLGDVARMNEICRRYGIEEVIVAIPKATGAQLRRIMETCRSTSVRFKTLPGVGDLIDGKFSLQHIREIDLEDLLGRAPAALDTDRIREYLEGKRVLVTGAGGSIGSEICRQVARFCPARLILLDHAETPLFRIEQELLQSSPGLHLRAVVGDIRDGVRLAAIFADCSPEVVFHAAAYKHVPMLEFNPAEAVDNNILGTKVVADAADAGGVRHFVMLSTDKAVNPGNVMGVSKRVAEIYIQALSRRSRTQFVTVRFGNVLGSSGSVVPLFREQIRAGGPVTVTHPGVTRYFMTIPEASQLVLQAGSMGKGGEIFLLDMGDPVRIVHLAEELIRLSGLRPYKDIDITFTGLRPGEKLNEELFLASEGIMPTAHEKIMVASATVNDDALLNLRLEKLFRYARAMDIPAMIAMMKEIVPEYCDSGRLQPGKIYRHPACTGDIALSSKIG